ncbi:hypothetical protein SAMN00790413_04556 [Deinococcus hopiensis KR-140]|uniref:Uncharacterized protein n=2 Tax=Deinococcus TaxID=1298 RepID=A0A1W1UJZ7_9DEIO|nr:hypothetical protein SAMN00790413_04556 [Deinococcus hopiensis KR-140]
MTVDLQKLGENGINNVHLLTARDSDAEAFYAHLGFRGAPAACAGAPLRKTMQRTPALSRSA